VSFQSQNLFYLAYLKGT